MGRKLGKSVGCVRRIALPESNSTTQNNTNTKNKKRNTKVEQKNCKWKDNHETEIIDINMKEHHTLGISDPVLHLEKNHFEFAWSSSTNGTPKDLKKPLIP